MPLNDIGDMIFLKYSFLLHSSKEIWHIRTSSGYNPCKVWGSHVFSFNDVSKTTGAATTEYWLMNICTQKQQRLCTWYVFIRLLYMKGYIVHVHNQFKNSLIFFYPKLCAAGKRKQLLGPFTEKNLNSRFYCWSM